MAIEQCNILEKTDKTELYLLYVNCLEVHMNSVSAYIKMKLSLCSKPVFSTHKMHLVISLGFHV